MTEKRYFWLKLHDNFFEQEEIKLIESLPNGKDYIIFYMKLLLKGIKNEGKLLFKDVLPYTPETLSIITNTNVDIVKQAIDYFIKFEMITKYDDGTLFLTQCNNLFGSETSAAERMRKHRENKTLEDKRNIVTPMLQNSYTDIDKEIDIDIDSSLEEEEAKIKRTPYEKIVELYHTILRPLGFTRVKFITKDRRTKIKKRWESELPTLESWEKYFKEVAESDFLCGRKVSKDGKPFYADFDWLICPSNCVKVLEQKYSNVRY